MNKNPIQVKYQTSDGEKFGGWVRYMWRIIWPTIRFVTRIITRQSSPVLFDDYFFKFINDFIILTIFVFLQEIFYNILASYLFFLCILYIRK